MGQNLSSPSSGSIHGLPWSQRPVPIQGTLLSSCQRWPQSFYQAYHESLHTIDLSDPAKQLVMSSLPVIRAVCVCDGCIHTVRDEPGVTLVSTESYFWPIWIWNVATASIEVSQKDDVLKFEMAQIIFHNSIVISDIQVIWSIWVYVSHIQYTIPQHSYICVQTLSSIQDNIMQSINFLHSDFRRSMLRNKGKVSDSYGKERLVRTQYSILFWKSFKYWFF